MSSDRSTDSSPQNREAVLFYLALKNAGTQRKPLLQAATAADFALHSSPPDFEKIKINFGFRKRAAAHG